MSHASSRARMDFTMRASPGLRLASRSRPHAVSDSTDIEYEISSQLAPQAVDVHFHSIALDLLSPAVEPLFDLRAREYVSGALHQELKQREFLWGQGDVPAIPHHLVCRRVERDTQVLDPGRRSTGFAPQQRTDPGSELIEIEWLYQVVV